MTRHYMSPRLSRFEPPHLSRVCFFFSPLFALFLVGWPTTAKDTFVCGGKAGTAGYYRTAAAILCQGTGYQLFLYPKSGIGDCASCSAINPGGRAKVKANWRAGDAVESGSTGRVCPHRTLGQENCLQQRSQDLSGVCYRGSSRAVHSHVSTRQYTPPVLGGFHAVRDYTTTE